MNILVEYKEFYLKFLKDTQPATQEIIEHFFDEYDRLKDTHTFDNFSEALQNPEKVYYLDLSNKDLPSLPQEISLFPNVKALSLSNNPLKSTQGLEKLTQLEAIFIQSAGLDVAPPEIGELTKLTSINLDNNNISEIPSSYFKLPLLTGFNMDNNNIMHISEEVQKAQNLTGFYLDKNKFDAFPLHVCFIPELKILTLNGNKIPTIPKSIQNLGKLVLFSLDDSEIKSIPKEFCNLHYLQKITISSNKLTKIPERIGELKSLKRITIRSKILKVIPESITSLPELERLEIKSPQLEKLPDSFDQLEKLAVLKIEGSEKTNIPYSIFRIKSLRAISFFNFNLSDLPDLSQLENLESLYLGGNQITTIPPSVGRLKKLQTLILWNNKLDKIPEELGVLSNLITLDVSKNYLNSLPLELRNLRKLGVFKFDHNPLTQMPQLRGMGIDSIFEYFRRISVDFHSFEWQMPPELTEGIQEYLDFFPQFARQIIGQEVILTANNTPTGLEISISLSEEVTMEDVNELFTVYFKMTRESIEQTLTGMHNNFSGDKVFMTELELQINHLKNQIRVFENENRSLREVVSRLSDLRENNLSSSSPIDSVEFGQQVYNKKELKELVRKNRIEIVLDILNEIIPEERTNLYNSMINLSARYMKFLRDHHSGRLTPQEVSYKENEIRMSILGIIDDYFLG